MTLPWLAAFLLAALLAVLALANAASQIGLEVRAFRPLGASFYTWTADIARVEQRLAVRPETAGRLRLAQVGEAALVQVPLSPRALRLVALDQESAGERAAAYRTMARAEQVTRRDGPVQLWLAERAIRRNDAATALRHYDTILRTQPEARRPVLERLTGVLPFADARRALQPFMRADSIWFTDFLQVAAERSPRIAPLADLLLAVDGPLPDSPGRRGIYAFVIERLARENEPQRLVRLYRRLPGSDLAQLTQVAPPMREVRYPPVEWFLPDDSAASGDVIAVTGGMALNLYAAPGRTGLAASKLFEPRGATGLRWRVMDVQSNTDAEARWVARCLAGPAAGRITRSSNLFTLAGRTATMPLPGNCSILLLVMDMVGGTGRDTANLTVAQLTVLRPVGAARTNARQARSASVRERDTAPQPDGRTVAQ